MASNTGNDDPAQGNGDPGPPPRTTDAVEEMVRDELGEPTAPTDEQRDEIRRRIQEGLGEGDPEASE